MKKTLLGIAIVILVFVGILTAFLLFFRQNYNLKDRWNMTDTITSKTVVADFFLTFEKSIFGKYYVSGTLNFDEVDYNATETSLYKTDIVEVEFTDEKGNTLVGFFDSKLNFAAIYFDSTKATFAGPTTRIEAAGEIAGRIF